MDTSEFTQTSSHRYIINCVRYISSQPTSLISVWTLIQRDVNTNQLLMERNRLCDMRRNILCRRCFRMPPSERMSKNVSEPRENVRATASSRLERELNRSVMEQLFLCSR